MTGVAARLRGIAPPLVGFGAFFLFWELAVRLTHAPVLVAPSASATIERLIARSDTFGSELLYTFAAAAVGLLIGVTAGIIGAVVMSQSRLLERSLFPLAVILKLTPFVAIVPLLVVWIGYNLWPKIIIVALITFFPVLVNCITGLRAVDPLALDFFQSMGAGRREVLLMLRFPSALPYVFSALKVSINLSLIGAVVGEFFGSDHGVGKVINQASQALDMRTMFAGLVVLAAVGVCLTVITNVMERRLLYWYASERNYG